MGNVQGTSVSATTVTTSTITTTGNVGIGTANPGSLLQVYNSAASYTTAPTVQISDGISDNTGTYGMINLSRPAAVTDNKSHVTFIRTGSATNSFGYYQNSNTFGWVPASNMNITFGIWITNNGSVGIGVTNPFGIFQIACTSSTNQDNAPDGGGNHGLVFTSPKTGSSVYAMAMGVDYTTGYGYINGAGNSAIKPILLQSRGGYVGIGTTNPGSALTVNGSISINNPITLNYSSLPSFAAGQVGSILQAAGTGTVISNNTNTNILQLTISPGVWIISSFYMVQSTGVYAAAITTSYSGISNVSQSINNAIGANTAYWGNNGAMVIAYTGLGNTTIGQAYSQNHNCFASLSSSTIYYLVVRFEYANTSQSTTVVNSYLSALRIA